MYRYTIENETHMWRVWFLWREMKIHSYTAMLYLGFVLGIAGGAHAAKLHGLDPKRVYVVMVVLILPALIGGRLLFVATHWEAFRYAPRRIWRSGSGAALYGGLLFSLVISLPIVRILDVSITGFWDSMAIAMLIGLVPSKMGCLLNGCCSGRESTGRFALYLPNENGIWRRRIPTQLFEAGGAVILLTLSFSIWNRFPQAGVTFFLALGGYSTVRWLIESRREAAVMFAGMNLNRLISAALAAISVSSLLFMWFRNY